MACVRANANLMRLEKGQVLEMELKQETFLYPEASMITYMVDRQKHHLSNHYYELIGDDMEVHQDEELAVVVMHNKRAVILTKSSLKERKKISSEQVFALQDSLVRSSKILSSVSTTLAGRPLLLVKTAPSKEMQSRTRLGRVDYFIDTKQHRVVKIDSHFLPNKKIKKTSTTFERLEVKQDEKSRKNALSQVFDSKGNLLRKYQGYQVIRRGV